MTTPGRWPTPSGHEGSAAGAVSSAVGWPKKQVIQKVKFGKTWNFHLGWFHTKKTLLEPFLEIRRQRVKRLFGTDLEPPVFWPNNNNSKGEIW